MRRRRGAVGVLARSLPALNPGTYLTIEAGTPPVVVSAPHGCTLAVPGVPARQTGTTVLDTNTYELATAVLAALLVVSHTAAAVPFESPARVIDAQWRA